MHSVAARTSETSLSANSPPHWAAMTGVAVVAALGWTMEPLALIPLVGIALVNQSIAWFFFFVSLGASGHSMQIDSFTILPEHVALLVLLPHVLGAKSPEHAVNTRASRLRRLAGWSAGGWILVALITSALVAPEPNQSLKLTLWLAVGVFSCWMVLKAEMSAKVLLRPYAFSLVVHAVLAMGGWAAAQTSGSINLFVERDYASEAFRAKGLMLEPNILAFHLTLGAILVLSCRKSLPPRLVNLVASLSLLVTILTFTRVAWVAWVVIAMALVWRIGSRAFVPAAVLIGLVCALALSLSGLDMDRTALAALNERAGNLFEFDSGTGKFRAETSEVAWREILDGPILTGDGTNAFPQLHSSDLTSTGELYLGFWWLALLYDAGLFGLGLFTLAFVSAARAGRGFGGFPLAVAAGVFAVTTNPFWYVFPYVVAGIAMKCRAEQEGSG